MGRPPERYCLRGHDKDAVGRTGSGACRECTRINNREKYARSEIGIMRRESRRLAELDAEAELAKVQADLAAMRERVRKRRAKQAARQALLA